MKKYFWVSLEYSELVIVAIWSEKETEKTISISKHERLFGSACWIPKRLNKNLHHIFETIQEALKFIIHTLDDKIKIVEDKRDELYETRKNMFDLLYEFLKHEYNPE